MIDRDERSRQVKSASFRTSHADFEISEDTPDEVLLKGQFEEISLQRMVRSSSLLIFSDSEIHGQD